MREVSDVSAKGSRQLDQADDVETRCWLAEGSRAGKGKKAEAG